MILAVLLIGLLGGLAIIKVWSKLDPLEHDERRTALVEELKTRLAHLSASVFFLALAGVVLIFRYSYQDVGDATTGYWIAGYGVRTFLVFIMTLSMGLVNFWFAVDLDRIRAWEWSGMDAVNEATFD